MLIENVDTFDNDEPHPACRPAGLRETLNVKADEVRSTEALALLAQGVDADAPDVAARLVTFKRMASVYFWSVLRQAIAHCERQYSVLKLDYKKRKQQAIEEHKDNIRKLAGVRVLDDELHLEKIRFNVFSQRLEDSTREDGSISPALARLVIRNWPSMRRLLGKNVFVDDEEWRIIELVEPLPPVNADELEKVESQLFELYDSYREAEERSANNFEELRSEFAEISRSYRMPKAVNPTDIKESKQ